MKLKYLFYNLRLCLLTTVLPAVGFVLAGPLVLAEVGPTLVQENIRVTGLVTSATDGLGLPGLSIILKGTNTGTVTNEEGRYTIEAPGDGVLVFSFVGFETQEVAVGGRTVIDMVMAESSLALDEVVVTALGIKREEKSLGFSVGKVRGEEFTRVAQENVLNSM